MKFKKVFLLLIAFVLSFSLIACEKEDENSGKEEELENVLKGVIIDKAYKNLDGDLPLPDIAGVDYIIEWSIDSKYAANAVIAYDDNGMPYIDVTQTEEDVKFTLVATISEAGVSASRPWNDCWVRKIAEASVTTCADVYNAAKDELLQISGVVTCVGSNQGYWVKDETGYAFVYDKGANGVSVGDTVTVKGSKSTNYTLHQLIDPAIVDKKSGTFDAKANEVVTNLVEIDVILDSYFDDDNKEVIKKFGTIYTFEGKIVKNTDSNISYDYLVVDPLTGKYIVVYDKYMPQAVKDAVKNNLNKYVSMTATFWDTHTARYGRFAPISVEAKTQPTYTDEQIVNGTKVMLQDKIPSKTSMDLTLPTTNDFAGLTITWASSNETALSNEGKIGSSSNDTETVTLTAVIKLGEVEATATFTVEVSFPQEVSVLKVLETCDLKNDSVVRFKGKIIALDKDGYPYIADSTAVVYVRVKLPEGVNVNDVVKVSGVATIYDNSGKQYTRQIKDAQFTKVEEEVEVISPVEVTIDQLQKLAANEGILDASSITSIKENELYGKLITITGYVTVRGSYGNAFIAKANDTESDAVLYYHLSANQDEIKQYAGKKVTLVCTLYDCQGTDGWRLGTYISITEITE